MKKTLAILLLSAIMGAASDSGAVRIKDIASFQIESDAALIGYGLVIGLDGTGDSKSSKFTMQSLSNMMERMGVTVLPEDIKVKNVASVIVTARLSPFIRHGSRIDCTVSSLGDASSLQGGMLLVTPLSGHDGVVYATAQGPVSIGGFNIQTGGGDRVSENYTLVGQVPGGAIVERKGDTQAAPSVLVARLINPDYTTAHRIAERINVLTEGDPAVALDEGNIQIAVPESYRTSGGFVNFISTIETLDITPDASARVVINEKTGTIVAGEFVTISSVALAHGSLKIEIKATPQVSQPEPFSGGKTVLTKDSEITAESETAESFI